MVGSYASQHPRLLARKKEKKTKKKKKLNREKHGKKGKMSAIVFVIDISAYIDDIVDTCGHVLSIDVHVGNCTRADRHVDFDVRSR